tara:strand:- start:424 stop:627 length:204 start_codon:yes stop_codon:yes gene_type:complete
MSTTAVLKNYPFMNNYNLENNMDFIYHSQKKKYEDKYSFDFLMQNIRHKREILDKKEKINNLIFKGI